MPKVLCIQDGPALARMNSVFRAIDLLSLLLSPILSGVLMTFLGENPASKIAFQFLGWDDMSASTTRIIHTIHTIHIKQVPWI